MKHATVTILLFQSFFCPILASDCLISMEPQWDNLCKDPDHIVRFGGKWIVIGSISFRKKTKDPTKLETLKLAWRGKQIDYLHGSLYKKFPEKQFMAIEQNLVCDSTWNKARQEMTLDFRNNQQTLGPLNIFYLVLTVPPAMEETLKSGHFSLLKGGLPESFQPHTDSIKLDIAQYINNQSSTPATS